MTPGDLYGRGIAFPPRVGADGRLAWSEGEANIRENIEIILRTEERERLNLPTFGGGLRTFLFEPNTVTTRFQIQDRITRALQQWEPRIVISSVDVEEDPRDPRSAVATVNYQLVATRAAAQVSLRVQLGG
ncbi:MAG: GPW/gp25 family protein [Acidobacteria bacterium]|nr:GPW/gp25 family protein [Acidobacteriota bacterium]MBV9478971.1 GPW/gp25 family protein [Acidobacteriota bacterium]